MVCAAVGAAALVWGILRYQDWQWLAEHFPQGGSSKWTDTVISGYQTTAVLAIVTGALGFVTFFLAFFFVRRALDEDKGEDIKRWTLLAGITGVLPGLVFGGLLEFFIWRAHAQESFTIFGLLGAPQAAPEAAAAAVPAYNPAAEEAKRKTEYDMLFASPPPAPAAPAYNAPAYGYAPAAPAYGYPPQAAAQPAAEYGYAPAAEAPSQGGAAAETGTQYYAQPSGAPICTCGRPMEWVAEYNRYYCYTDDRYEGES